MSREEKIDKILEMTKEILKLMDDLVSDMEIDQLYIQTRIALETYKELKGESRC